MPSPLRPAVEARFARGRDFPFFSVQFLYAVELELSLRMRLARYTHVRRMCIPIVEKSIARLVRAPYQCLPPL